MKKGQIWWGAAIALALAALVSPFASPWPDGLERVAEQLGFLHRGEVRLFSAPLADYLIPGLAQEALGTALAGLVGTLLALALGWGLGRALKARSRTETGSQR
ncbi:MAG: PDGLE domain-containing protein [Bacillota bacterium]|nr:PDGLE domain-containing protein [Bacillota bacterium]